MIKELKAIFEEVDQTLFTEDTLAAIAKLVQETADAKAKEKVTLEVESALTSMDDKHSVMFENAINAYKAKIDADHTAKMKTVVEKLNKDHITKLYTIKEKYDEQIHQIALEHRDQVVEGVNVFLEDYIDKNLPIETIKEAAKNTYTQTVLREARQVLGIDEKFVKGNVKEAIIEGKTQIDKFAKENAELKKQLMISESRKILAEKTANLPNETAKFVRSRLGNKTASFIAENFDYVLAMFERQDRQVTRSVLNESKKSNNVDRNKVADEILKQETSKIVAENAESSESTLMEMYVDGMNFRK